MAQMEICPLDFHSLTNPVRASAEKEAKTYSLFNKYEKLLQLICFFFFLILLISNALYFKSLHAFLRSLTTKRLRRHFCVFTSALYTPTFASVFHNLPRSITTLVIL